MKRLILIILGAILIAPAAAQAEDPPCWQNKTVTINHGARFTNDPNVTVTAGSPGCDERVEVSNDGGFSPSQWMDAGDFAWTLPADGQERLPKVVYVRFRSGQVLTDDIILDTIAPTITDASLVAGAASVATESRFYKIGRLRVRVRDSNSGIRRVTAKRLSRHRYRVWARDKAGNVRRKTVRV